MTEREMLDELLAATGAGRRRLRIAGACGVLASLSAVALLGLSGWFLTAAGLAGLAGVAAVQAFNYLIPSAAIRLLAILRTVGRYGERLLGHQAALEGMADLRTRLFSRRAAIDTRNDARDPRAASAILLDDIAALEDIVIRRPAVVAGVAGGLVSVALVALAGWGAALFQAVALFLLPMAIWKMAERFTAMPSADVADRLIAMRATFTDYAAARSEIAAYGLTPRVMKQLEPTFHGYEAAKAKLLRGKRSRRQRLFYTLRSLWLACSCLPRGRRHSLLLPCSPVLLVQRRWRAFRATRCENRGSKNRSSVWRRCLRPPTQYMHSHPIRQWRSR